MTNARATTGVMALVVVALATVAALGAVTGVAGAQDRAWATIPAPVGAPHRDAVQAAMDDESQAMQRDFELAETAAAVATATSAHAAQAQAAAQAQYAAELREQAAARAARFRQSHTDAHADAGADEDEGEDEGEAAAAEEEAASVHPDSLLQVQAAADLAQKAARRPRGIGHIALPRLDGRETRVDVARKLWRERIRRKLRSGGMMRRYAPELFGQDVYGMDDNDNVKIGSRATIWDAMNGPFAPMPKPSSLRPKPSADAVKMAMLRDAQAHRKLDDAQGIRHNEYYLKTDPTASAYTYLPRNHRNPFGLNKIFARARRDMGLDVGPFDGPRFRHTYANPVQAFSRGIGFQRNSQLPLPSNPRLPFAEADASIAGFRPSKLQQFREFTPPPQIPKMVDAPNADKSDNPSVGQGDTPE